MFYGLLNREKIVKARLPVKFNADIFLKLFLTKEKNVEILELSKEID